jgi:hypothetical protein
VSHIVLLPPPKTKPHPQEPSGCRWIDGEVPGLDWRYCQHPVQAGSSYCCDHHKRAYLTGDDAEHEEAKIEWYAQHGGDWHARSGR